MTTAPRLRLRSGLAERLRETRDIPTEEAQAALIGVNRTTLRRVIDGGRPSNAFMAQFCVAFGLGLGEAFEVVEEDPDASPPDDGDDELAGAVDNPDDAGDDCAPEHVG